MTSFPWVDLGRLFKCFILVISLKNYRKINYLAIYWMSNVRMSKLKLQAKHRVGKKWQQEGHIDRFISQVKNGMVVRVNKRLFFLASHQRSLLTMCCRLVTAV
jgi:hypothetical protein